MRVDASLVGLAAMRTPFWASVLAITVATAMAAEEPFSKAVRTDDFAAAGLSKLTPEELARLDGLVRDYKSGALAAAQQQLAAAQAKAAEAEAKARMADVAAKAKAEEAEKKLSLLDRAKVLLTPGTQVEYSTLESRLKGDFNGWERGTVFVLENGQRWRTVGNSSYVTPPAPAPKVRIVPGALGSFFIEIEGVRQRVRVESLDVK